MPRSHWGFLHRDGDMYNYTRDASRCLAILSINTSRLFTEDLVIPPEHRLMLVNFHRECIGDAKKSPVGPSQKGNGSEQEVRQPLIVCIDTCQCPLYTHLREEYYEFLIAEIDVNVHKLWKEENLCLILSDTENSAIRASAKFYSRF